MRFDLGCHVIQRDVLFKCAEDLRVCLKTEGARACDKGEKQAVIANTGPHIHDAGGHGQKCGQLCEHLLLIKYAVLANGALDMIGCRGQAQRNIHIKCGKALYRLSGGGIHAAAFGMF